MNQFYFKKSKSKKHGGHALIHIAESLHTPTMPIGEIFLDHKSGQFGARLHIQSIADTTKWVRVKNLLADTVEEAIAQLNQRYEQLSILTFVDIKKYDEN